MRVPRKRKKRLRIIYSPFQNQSKRYWNSNNRDYKNMVSTNPLWKKFVYYK